MLSGTPILNKNFRWETNFNFAQNATEVLDLGEGVTEIVSGGAAGSNSIRQTVGQSLNGLYATAYLRDAQGRQVLIQIMAAR